jgi:hypothetical protein
MEKDSKENTDKKEKKIDKKEENKGSKEQPAEAVPTKSSTSLSNTFLTILKYTLMASVVFVVLGIIIYLTLANMAFFGFLPSKMTEKMPIVSKIVKDIEAKERRIKIAKELRDDQLKIEKAGELQIDLLEGQDAESKDFVPFLYKLRVIKNRINNKELAEIWVDNVLVVKIFAGIGENSPYARATYMVKKINGLLNNKADFNQLMPVIDGDIHKAEILGEELFRVSEEDAIFNNSTQVELLYAWVNNLRVSLGASLFQVPKFIVKQTDVTKDNKELVPTAQQAATAVGQQGQPVVQPGTAAAAVAPVTAPTITDEAKLKDKQLKAVIKVYEKLPDEKVSNIFNKMKQDELVNVLKYLSVKKMSKVVPLLTGDKAVAAYRNMINNGTTAEQAKTFKRYIQIWEKVPDDQVVTIFKKMTVDEKLAIFRKISVKKKAKVFDVLPADEAKLYLQLLEEPVKPVAAVTP